MQVIKVNEIPKQAADSPLFTGGPVSRQPLVTDTMGSYFVMNMVNFSRGARNKFHTHASDQVLLVTAGTGIVATDQEQRVVSTGDIIHIPAGEKHWHGATPESEFSHISLTAVGSKTTQAGE